MANKDKGTKATKKPAAKGLKEKRQEKKHKRDDATATRQSKVV